MTLFFKSPAQHNILFLHSLSLGIWPKIESNHLPQNEVHCQVSYKNVQWFHKRYQFFSCRQKTHNNSNHEGKKKSESTVKLSQIVKIEMFS
jgi:hypothetical protein